MRIDILKISIVSALFGLLVLDTAFTQNSPPAAASMNPFGAMFDRDPTRSDSEIRYNASETAGYDHIIGGQGMNSTAITGASPDSIASPTDQQYQVKIVDGVPVVSRRNAVSGVEWEDINSFSRHGSAEFPEEKLHNELRKPMPERRPFGDRMKEISNQLKGTVPD